MAGRSRRSSTELEPDLSKPTAPKRPKQSETSSESSGEEHLTEVESTETPTTSEISLQAEVELVREGDKRLSDVTEQPGTSKQSVISEASSESTKQSSQTDPDLPKRESDTASILTEAIPSTSREEPSGTLVVMKYSDQGELSGPSGKRPECETTVQSSLPREHSFEDLSLIGNGAYGTVYKAKNKTSGQIVALKKVRIPLTEDGLPSSTVREISALKSLEQYEHPHIVSIF